MVNGTQMVQGSNISMDYLYSGVPLAKWLFLNYYGRNIYEYPSRNTYGSKSLIFSCIRAKSMHGLNKPTQLKTVAVLGESVQPREQNPHPKIQSKKRTRKQCRDYLEGVAGKDAKKEKQPEESRNHLQQMLQLFM